MAFCRDRTRSGMRKALINLTQSGTYDLRRYGLRVGDVIDIWIQGASGGYGGDCAFSTGYVIRNGRGGSPGCGYTYYKLNIILTSTMVTLNIGVKGSQGESKIDGTSGAPGTMGGDTKITVNGITYTAAGGWYGGGGSQAAGGYGGKGGSGGGSGGYYNQTGDTVSSEHDGTNGTNGGNGQSVGGVSGGTGQGTTTKPFGDTVYDPSDNFGENGKAKIRLAA